MRFAKRLDLVPPYLFAELERKIDEKRRQGVDVISLGIGDPDLPTPEPVIRALQGGSRGPDDAPVPDKPRTGAVSRRNRGLLQGEVRCRRRPGNRGRAGPGRQGRGRPHRLRLSRSGRRRARAGARLPALHIGAPLRRRGRPLPAAQGGERVHARPGCGPGRRGRSGQPALPQLPEQPDRSRGRAGLLRPGGRVRPCPRPHRRPRQRLFRDRLRRLRGTELPRDERREGGRRRDLLALQGLEHDRLARRLGGGERGGRGAVPPPEDQPRLRACSTRCSWPAPPR